MGSGWGSRPMRTKARELARTVVLSNLAKEHVGNMPNFHCDKRSLLPTVVEMLSWEFLAIPAVI
jgi:hypothetical protein